MPSRDWTIRIQDIRKAASKIIEHTKDMEFDAFARDEWLQDAVLRNLTIIGEAVILIPEDIVKNLPDVPVRYIKGLRNNIVHAYFRIEPRIVWDTIQDELPKMLAALDKISGIN